MRINISSRELRSALALITDVSSPLVSRWQDEHKLVQYVAYRAFTDGTGELADELEHPDYEHARAVRLAREMFDAGIAVVEILDEELRNTADTTDLRRVRGAVLAFMETIASYLSPLAALRAAGRRDVRTNGVPPS